MRDRYGTNNLGLKALVEGVRKVKDCVLLMNGRKYTCRELASLEGQSVVVSVIDNLATEYQVRHFETHEVLCQVDLVGKYNPPPVPVAVTQ